MSLFRQQQQYAPARIGQQRFGQVGQEAAAMMGHLPARVGQFPMQTGTFDGTGAALIPGSPAGPFWGFDASVPTRRALVEADVLQNPQPTLMAVPGTGPTVGNVCGFIERCRTIAPCSIATIKLKTRLPVQIQRLGVFGKKDAKHLFIRKIISGCNILTTGKGFSAKVLLCDRDCDSDDRCDFDIDCANIAFDFFHPLEFEVENTSEKERDFHVIAQVWQLVC